MHTFIHSPLQIGSLSIPHRLIQGPLAGYSCAPFRTLFQLFKSPAYCVSEMSSAQNILYRDKENSRYLYRAPEEHLLAYQLSGTNPEILKQAALKLEAQGADLIDINCGCPKTKIRKKGAGSALLETPDVLVQLVTAIKTELSIPLTVKIRIQGNAQDLILAKRLEQAGADALIIHGRTWREDYNIPCNYTQMARIKRELQIPVIANGDIRDSASLYRAIVESECDAFMIGRAGTGRPWLYQELLESTSVNVSLEERIRLFLLHLEGLAVLESEYKAVLQGKSLVRYYFKQELGEDEDVLKSYYALNTLAEIASHMKTF